MRNCYFRRIATSGDFALAKPTHAEPARGQDLAATVGVAYAPTAVGLRQDSLYDQRQRLRQSRVNSA